MECQPLAFEMTGGRHIDADKYLNSLFRKSAKIGDPYAMPCAASMPYAASVASSAPESSGSRLLLRRPTSRTTRAANFLSPLPLITAVPSRALPLCPIGPLRSSNLL